MEQEAATQEYETEVFQQFWLINEFIFSHHCTVSRKKNIIATRHCNALDVANIFSQVEKPGEPIGISFIPRKPQTTETCPDL